MAYVLRNVLRNAMKFCYVM